MCDEVMLNELEPKDLKIGQTVIVRDQMGQEHKGELLANSEKGICAYSELTGEDMFWRIEKHRSRWIVMCDTSANWEKLKSILDDTIGGIFYYDRKECDVFFPGQIEYMVKEGFIPYEKIFDHVKEILQKNLEWTDSTAETYAHWKKIIEEE